MRVRDVMVRRLVSCAATDDLETASWRMIDAGVSCLPVLEGDRPVGLLSHRDVARACLATGRPLSDLGVAAALQPVLRSCWPDDTIEAVQAIMRAYRVGRLLVLDRSGALVGLVTLGDIASALLCEQPAADPERIRAFVETRAEVSCLPVDRQLGPGPLRGREERA